MTTLRNTMRRALFGGPLAVAVLATVLLAPDEARGHGRSMAFERLGLDAGLSQSSVLAIHQDRLGFLWVGTEDGLNLYDGYGFTTYYRDLEDENALRSDWIWSMAEDAEGALWIATDGGGLARWNVEGARFEGFSHDPDDPTSLASDRLRALTPAADGRFWVATRDAGLDLFDPRTGTAEHFRHDPGDPSSLAHDSVYAVRIDRQGVVWVGSDGGLQRFDPGSRGFEPAAALASLEGLDTPPKVRAILEDGRGRLWVGTSKSGLIRLDAARSSAERFVPRDDDPHSLAGPRVLALLEDADDRLWVGTDGGLGLWNERSEDFFNFPSDAGDPRSLGGDEVMSLFQDRSGILWVGTRTAGLSKWNPATWQFGHVTVTPTHSGGLSERNVTAFTEDPGGRLWIGTFGGGIDVLDRRTGEFTHHRPKDGRGLGSLRISSLAQGLGGRIWVGTFDAGLHRYDPGTDRFTAFRHDPDDPRSLSADAVTSLLLDSRGSLWVGTYGGGVNRLDPGTSSFTRYRAPEEGEGTGGGLTSDRVTTLTEHLDGSIWVGTEGGGLNLVRPRTGQVVTLRYDEVSPRRLLIHSVTAVHADSAGTVWVGTRGGGLVRLEVPTATAAGTEVVASTRIYGKRQGLPNDMVYGIRSDRAGRLWISTNAGLSRFDPATERFTNYDVVHGLQANEFHFGSHYQSVRGELFFGGVNGYNAFQPERLRTDSDPPPVVLTGFYKLNEPVLDAGPAPGLERVELDFRDDLVSFEFAALDFTAPGRNRYRYRLEGLDEDWIELRELRRVTFTDLDPGRYVLRVQAANADGVWNQEGLSLPLSVEAPPWASGWAYLGYALLGATILVGWVRIGRSRLEREARYSRELEKEVATRTAELSNRTEELEHLNQKLAEASLTDSLTGMANRRFVFEYLRKEVALLDRRHLRQRDGKVSTHPMSLVFLMMDLDHFKEVNDTWGHLIGDELLKQMRSVLQEACREADILVRWGGDEFLIVGRESDPETVTSLAERIRERVANHPFQIGEGRVVHTSCSIGFACYPFGNGDDGSKLSWEQVLTLADQALYSAKRSRRNLWVGLFPTSTTPTEGLLSAVRDDLWGLVSRGELTVRTSRDDLEDRLAGASATG